MKEAHGLPFSEIVKVTGHLTFDEIARMVGAPNWEPETEAAKYRTRYFTIKLREAMSKDDRPSGTP
jgi:hypothetical protein